MLGPTFSDLYIDWCSKNDYVASDVEVAYFAGVTSGAPYYPRKKMAEDGFVFEKNGHGWIITAPPEINDPLVDALIERGYSKQDAIRMAELIGAKAP
jgi:hypothetical protein